MNDCFELPAELNIYTVAEVREALLDWLRAQATAGTTSVALAAAKVAEVDSAGIQLLGALTRSLAQQGLAWVVREPSPVLVEACGALGALDWLAPSTAAADAAADAAGGAA